MKTQYPHSYNPLSFKRLGIALAVCSTTLLPPAVRASNITWSGSYNAVWVTGSNWYGQTVPGVNDVAIFNNAGNGYTTIDFVNGGSSTGTAGSFLFDTASAAAYTIGKGGAGAQTLVLGNSASITVTSSVAATETFNASLVLGTDGSAQTFKITNNESATSGTLVFAGNIAGSTGAGVKTLAISGSGLTRLNGVISDGTTGKVAIVKSGAGTLIVGGYNNTFTGGITFNEGSVIWRGYNNPSTYSNTSLAVTGNGGTFGLDGSGDNAGSRTLGLGSLTMATGESTIYVSRAPTSSYTLQFSSYARQAGAIGLFLGTNTNNTFGGGSVTTAIGGTTGNGGFYKITGQAVGFIDQGTFIGTGTSASFAWYDTTNGVRSIVYGSDAGTTLSTGGTSVSGTYVKVTGAVTAQTTAAFKTLQLGANTTFAVNSGEILTVDGLLKASSTAGTATISGGSIQAEANAEQVFRTALAGDVLAVNSNILANGTNLVTVSGAGVVQLGGSNTFTGGVSLASGILRLGSVNALNSAAPNSVTFSGSANTASLQLNGNSVSVAGLNGVSANSAVENISSGTAATLTINTSGSSTYAGAIRNGSGSAALSLVKTGTGTQILTGTNSYTGTTAVTGGVLTLGTTGALTGGTAISVDSGASFNVLKGASILASTALTNNGTVNFNNTTHTLASLSGTSSSAVLKLNSTALTVSGGGEYAGSITDGTSAGSLNITGGNLILDGANSYTGATTVSGGTLTLNGAIANSSVVTVSAGVLAGSGTAAGTLTGTGATISGNGLSIGATTLYGSSKLGGYNKASSLTVAGGTTSLTGTTQSTSTFVVSSGAALINNGTVDGSVSINSGLLKSTGAITHNLSLFSGTFSATGLTTVGGNFSLDQQSTLISEVTGTAAGAYGQVHVSGNVSLAGTLDLTLLSGLSLNDKIVLIDNQSEGNTTSGFFTSILTLDGTYTIASGSTSYAFEIGDTKYLLSYAAAENDGFANDIVLTVVPEPSTWIMLMGGMGALACLQRGRNRR